MGDKTSSAGLQLMEVYAGLKALRENLPQSLVIHHMFVGEYESILTMLEKISGFDLKNFKVPAEAMSRGLKDLHYNRYFVLTKIDGLLWFFELQWSDPKPTIGFKA